MAPLSRCDSEYQSKIHRGGFQSRLALQYHYCIQIDEGKNFNQCKLLIFTLIHWFYTKLLHYFFIST